MRMQPKKIKFPIGNKDRKLLESGRISVSQYANINALKVSQAWSRIYSNGIKIPKSWYSHVKITEEGLERFKQIKSLRDLGYSLTAIGEQFGIKRQRVFQILQKEESYKERGLL